jgi:hypothetical protein
MSECAVYVIIKMTEGLDLIVVFMRCRNSGSVFGSDGM